MDVDNAAAVRSPLASRYAGSIQSPDERITNAVSEQTTIVSMKTSNMPTAPCSAGCFTSAMPWAIGALPSPASLESTPRLTPAATTCAMVAPANPPTAADGVNAPPKIRPTTYGTWPMFMSRNSPAVATYSTIMAGTIRSATAAMRRMPPNSTRPTSTVISRPGTICGTSRPALDRAASTNVRATVFDCTMLPVPNRAVQAPKKANAYPRLLPSAGDGMPPVM